VIRPSYESMVERAEQFACQYVGVRDRDGACDLEGIPGLISLAAWTAARAGYLRGLEDSLRGGDAHAVTTPGLLAQAAAPVEGVTASQDPAPPLALPCEPPAFAVKVSASGRVAVACDDCGSPSVSQAAVYTGHTPMRLLCDACLEARR
jgi:hypothetical protein